MNELENSIEGMSNLFDNAKVECAIFVDLPQGIIKAGLNEQKYTSKMWASETPDIQITYNIIKRK
jgi:hypothetical protein